MFALCFVVILLPPKLVCMSWWVASYMLLSLFEKVNFMMKKNVFLEQLRLILFPSFPVFHWLYKPCVKEESAKVAWICDEVAFILEMPIFTCVLQGRNKAQMQQRIEGKYNTLSIFWQLVSNWFIDGENSPVALLLWSLYSVLSNKKGQNSLHSKQAIFAPTTSLSWQKFENTRWLKW